MPMPRIPVAVHNESSFASNKLSVCIPLLNSFLNFEAKHNLLLCSRPSVSEGLALELSAGGGHELWSFSTFSIEIMLTKKGVENYESVIEAVFQYAQKIRDVGP
jgi:secreted Zn-dependent insulinase-like peptidase